MRKWILTVAAACMVGSTTSMAGTIRDECGCGLGGMVLGDQEATMLMGFVGSLLNGLCANQTFGISSGTLDCAPASGFVGREKVIEFVSDNMDHLAMDMAMGQGETLEALADLMQKEDTDRQELFASLQLNFESIFTTSQITATEVVDHIDAVLGS